MANGIAVLSNGATLPFGITATNRVNRLGGVHGQESVAGLKGCPFATSMVTPVSR